MPAGSSSLISDHSGCVFSMSGGTVIYSIGLGGVGAAEDELLDRVSKTWERSGL